MSRVGFVSWSAFGVVTGLGILAVLLAFNINVAFGSLAGIPDQHEVREADGFRYSVAYEQEKVRGHVGSSNLGNPQMFQVYSTANRQRAEALIASGIATRVPLVLTFRKPVPIDDAKRLANETGLQADAWIIAKRRADGHKTSGAFPREVPSGLTTITTPRGEKETVLGIMVVSGTVPATLDGLGRLLADPRVYIADITEFEVRRLLTQDPKADGKSVEVVVETPFWQLDWW